MSQVDECINNWKKKGNVLLPGLTPDSYMIKLHFCPFMLCICVVVSVGLLNSINVRRCQCKKLISFCGYKSGTIRFPKVEQDILRTQILD